MQEHMTIEGNRRFRDDERIEALRDETAHDETLATAFEPPQLRDLAGRVFVAQKSNVLLVENRHPARLARHPDCICHHRAPLA
jgi:hypothetical protein